MGELYTYLRKIKNTYCTNYGHSDSCRLLRQFQTVKTDADCQYMCILSIQLQIVADCQHWLDLGKIKRIKSLWTAKLLIPHPQRRRDKNTHTCNRTRLKLSLSRDFELHYNIPGNFYSKTAVHKYLILALGSKLLQRGFNICNIKRQVGSTIIIICSNRTHRTLKTFKIYW